MRPAAPVGVGGRPTRRGTRLSTEGFIRVRGAREHNLRDVDVDVPRDALVVFTGVSGSGKSSLAFGTIYAEAQRRYFESVAPYARRLIQQVGAPAGRRDHRAAAGRRAAAAPRRADRPLDRRHPDHAVELAADAALPRRRPTRRARRGWTPTRSPRTPPAGACPECHGLGRVHHATEALAGPGPVAEHPRAGDRRLAGRLAGQEPARHPRHAGLRRRPARGASCRRPTATGSCSPTSSRWSPCTPEREAHRIQRPYQGTYLSARRYVLHTLASTGSAHAAPAGAAVRRGDRLPASATAPACGPRRWRSRSPAGRSPSSTALPLDELADVLRRGAAGSAGDVGGRRIVAATCSARIEVLVELGLGYLSTGPRDADAVGRRAAAAAARDPLRSGLFGVRLRARRAVGRAAPRRHRAAARVLDRLRRRGNSLFVVEHDMDVVRRADWLVDVGPGAGERGGRVLHSGPVAGLRGRRRSRRPGRYLFGAGAGRPRAARGRAAGGWLRLRGVTPAQPARPRRRRPARRLHRRHRRVRLGQVDAWSPRCSPTSSRDHLGADAAEPDDEEDADDDAEHGADRDRSARRRGVTGWTRSTGSCRSTSGRSAARRAPTWPPTPACSTGCASCSPPPTRPASAATAPAGSPSTSPAAAARPARARASSPSSCCSCRAPTRPCPACHGARYNPETLEVTLPRTARSPTCWR